jgi:hypothetical protein
MLAGAVAASSPRSAVLGAPLFQSGNAKRRVVPYFRPGRSAACDSPYH